ncbi:MAG: hypothetical protein HQM09_21730, partial [Candidatus Riflebacteria bacterium]|nr:hypothetical protein [Candidatus Riflebacteria bacterium]
LEYRGTKHLQDYLQALRPDSRNVIHARFKQLPAPTGRISAVEPNILAIPKLDNGAKKKADKEWIYRPHAGRAIVHADYPAIEMRISSVMADDATLITAFKEGLSPHKITAAKISGKSYDEVTSEEKDRAKPVNFGFQYGMFPPTFVDYAFESGLVINLAQAEEFRHAFLDNYSGIRRWHDETNMLLNESDEKIELVSKRTGRSYQVGVIPVRTLVGRRIKAAGLNAALSYQVQGTGADIQKTAVVTLGSKLRQVGLDAQIINMVHDAIYVECAATEKDAVKTILKESMESAVNSLLTEFVTEVDVGEIATGTSTADEAPVIHETETVSQLQR